MGELATNGQIITLLGNLQIKFINIMKFKMAPNLACFGQIKMMGVESWRQMVK